MRNAKRIAVIGAGAAGLYTLDLLMQCRQPLQVDLIDQAPAPIGLASFHQPAHPLQSARQQHLRVIGNVRLPAEELAPLYDAVIEARFHTDIEAIAAVSDALFPATPRPVATRPGGVGTPDLLDHLRARGIHYTQWRGTLDIPSDRSLSDWQAYVDTARGAPVCF